jgi:hypothetical protein
VKKLLALILAVLVGTAMVTVPMGCQGDKKAEPKKDGGTPAATPDKDKAPADKDKK